MKETTMFKWFALFECNKFISYFRTEMHAQDYAKSNLKNDWRIAVVYREHKN